MTATLQQDVNSLMEWAKKRHEGEMFEGVDIPFFSFLLAAYQAARDFFSHDHELAGAVWCISGKKIRSKRELTELEIELLKAGFTSGQVQDVCVCSLRESDYGQGVAPYHLLYDRIKKYGNRAIKIVLCCRIAQARIHSELGGSLNRLKHLPIRAAIRKIKETLFDPNEKELLPAWKELGKFFDWD